MATIQRWKLNGALLVTVLALVATLHGDLGAVVNQVDGTVVPVQYATPCPGADSGCLQTGLDYGEGIDPPGSATGPIDAVLDANTGPETFLIPTEPNGDFRTVNFRLLQEGAGFENIFGWYNVDDPTTRYPAIFSCATFGGNDRDTFEPPNYGTNPVSGGYTFQIDFQREFEAGRYDGGQVGFYLIAPEGAYNNSSAVDSDDPRRNCATDPDDQGILPLTGPLTPSGPIDDDGFDEGGAQDDDNGFGRIYFTESQLNFDGNYVHYLIYRSVNQPDQFYFAFEDLFRGGDNDYEDTMVKVEGLVPVCEPEQEICNGVDDNCNDAIDENVFRPCATICGDGQEQCTYVAGDPDDDRNWHSCDAQLPADEQCNGLDDDCNGTVDDLTRPCSTDCGPGTESCSYVGGAPDSAQNWSNCSAREPSAEVCDGLDNDCNTLIDDLTRACSNECGVGIESCSYQGGDPEDPGNWANCTAQQPTGEICNGLDDDCDGTIDNGVGGGEPCTDGTTGCAGSRVCQGDSGWGCVAPSPQAELCDGVDNDCNGQIDDGVTRACSTDCGVGIETCDYQAGAPDDDGNWVDCTAQQPALEQCNGVDDDCDGAIDNDVGTGGECTIGGCLGVRRCVGGGWQCDAPVPGEELCDGLDNNCNDEIDEGLIRSCFTACGFGSETCQFTDDNDPTNDWAGCTAPQPEDEVCDGVDNDCDGAVDDNVPGEGEPCDHPSGETCEGGLTKCVGGELRCVGATVGTAEICDCKDNDCDGEIDEGNPCVAGTQCIDCGCRVPCASKEFACPKGFACTNGFCVPDKCVGVTCPEGEVCLQGECFNPCAAVDCAPDQVCIEGSCVEDNCYGKGCPAGQVCLENACRADPCATVSCPAGQYCRAGSCLDSCGAALCGKGARCVDGECLENTCAGVVCATGVTCHDGRCDTGCRTVICGPGRTCRNGACIDDPCTAVRCYGANETCQQGQCISPTTFSGTSFDTLASGGGGVACALSATRPSAPWSLALLLGLCLLRRQRRALRRLAVLLCALALLSCAQDPLSGVVFDGGLADGVTGDAPPCVPSNGGVEICDRRDNDCNGQVDELFNLQTDPENCGECGKSCRTEGALTTCELGVCKNLGCAPGFYDLNQDLADGCEYACTPSRDREEVCDEADDDCNGEVDETFTLETDVQNCGRCGNICQLAHAVARCEEGQCEVLRCEAGFIDKDGQDDTGCEAPCVVTNDGLEICDSLDNDCDGEVDEDFDLQTDPLNCGGCGAICALPNANAECQAGQCTLVDCKGNHLNADGEQGNGCECLATGDESCDGVDNDCNGQVDDGLPPLGECGIDTGLCEKGTLVCQGGVPTCVGAQNPVPEVCDGQDNDCSGTADDNLPPSLGACGTTDVGECELGTLVCQGGTPTCIGEKEAELEVCDGRDNDCNGTADDGLPGDLGPCGSATGLCVEGHFECQSGLRVCIDAVGPQPEVCDGEDNDCSGTADDNLPAVLGPCGSTVGECRPGTLVCQDGAPTCVGDSGIQTEVCDGKDNDCDGTADNNLPQYPGVCGTDTGLCVAGQLLCQSGNEICIGAVGPAVEHCDGLDSDCDSEDDPTACVFAGSGREQRLDNLGETTLGANNSLQLHAAGSGDRIVAAWLDRRNGAGDIYTNLSDDGGQTWLAADRRVPGGPYSKFEPRVAFGGPSASAQRAYVVYGQPDGGGCGEDDRDNSDYCSAGCPCITGFGDCDGNSHCAEGEDSCISDIGAVFGYAASVDVCVRTGGVGAGESGGSNSGNSNAADNSNYCTDDDPCRHGFGDCDSDAQCRGDLICVKDDDDCNPSAGDFCVTDIGAYFGYTDDRDVCIDPEVVDITRAVFLRRSADAGQSWSTWRRLDTGDRDALFYRLAVRPGATAGDPDTVVVCWQDIATSGPVDPAIHCALSSDSGQSFGGQVQANGSGQPIVPQIAIDDAYLFVTWQDGPQIRAARSPLTGLSFAHERALNGSAAGQQPQIATDGAGNVIVVWEDVSGPLINIRANTSSNSGQSWQGTSVRVDNDVVDGDSIDPMVVMRPGAGGRALVVWSDTSRGQPDIYLSSSDDGGDSWAQAVRVSGDEAGASTQERPFIALAPDSDNVYVAWEDRRNGAKRDIYFNLSLDDGTIWNIPDYRIDEAALAGVSDAYGPLVIPSSGRAAVIWVETRALSGGTVVNGSKGDIYASFVD